ncbi:MAG TPA: DegT/DnrJ/EryC1/StrS family aminotransferase [Puia sp.]|nr:DegT/DnrJ/EryC1/StrS family aminotransferase [Puia sp.]
MINVTKTFLPPFEEYTAMLKRAWDKAWITNDGELSFELEKKLKEYLGVKNLRFCTNGTVVLQMSLKALNITGEIITTPFSYVATANAILWENCKPVFVDISEKNFCIDASKIESAITPNTQAILATHVYGYPCDVNAIEAVAKKHNLKVIYDAAHAFGTCINNESIFNYGDVSTCSFHATKLFHTVEGGCVITNDDQLSEKLYYYSHFGHSADKYFSIGINGKNSEFHSAMGLCNLKYIDDILESRKSQWLYYKDLLKDSELQFLQVEKKIKYNYAYFPVIFPSEDILLKTIEALKIKNIIPRRYFYPALNTLSYLPYQPCPVAEDIAKRIICLPLFHDLTKEQQSIITNIILEVLT